MAQVVQNDACVIQAEQEKESIVETVASEEERKLQ